MQSTEIPSAAMSPDKLAQELLLQTVKVTRVMAAAPLGTMVGAKWPERKGKVLGVARDISRSDWRGGG